MREEKQACGKIKHKSCEINGEFSDECLRCSGQGSYRASSLAFACRRECQAIFWIIRNESVSHEFAYRAMCLIDRRIGVCGSR
jgi:hypothetical protein